MSKERDKFSETYSKNVNFIDNSNTDEIWEYFKNRETNKKIDKDSSKEKLK